MPKSKQNREVRAHSAKRPARIPMGSVSKLSVPDHLKEDGYFYYWAVDRKGAIEQMEQAWYEKVTDERGDLVTVAAGNGETHYLMRIEQRYYDEDMARQQALNTDASNATAQEVGEHEYVPMGRKSVVEREII